MRKRVLLAVGGTVASVIMGASAVNGSIAERSSYYGYGCSAEKRAFADPWFDFGENAAGCQRVTRSAGRAKRTSPPASTW